MYVSVDWEAEQKDACFLKHCTASLGSLESFSKLNNSNMERRIRLARLRNLNNIYLVPQEDTILFYINVQLQKYGIEKTIVIDAEDTYVSVLAAYVAHQVEENLHRKRKRVIYDWKKRIMLCRTC